MTRPTHAQIFPENIAHNARRVRELAPNSRIMACVKADAYGHDIGASSDALANYVDGFAVACIEEALTLRSQHIDKPILMLEGPQSADEIAEALNKNLTLCINDWHQLEWLEEAGVNDALPCWLKIDTGMHRLGFQPQSIPEALKRLAPHIKVSELVLCTHFSSADLPGANGVSEQLKCFDDSVSHTGFFQSTANSAAIIRAPLSHRDWVRPGYMLYGGSPLADTPPGDLNLKPAMEFSAQVISVRDVPQGERVGYSGRWEARRPSRIATIAAGYGDGYPRHAPDGTPVFIDGQRLPLAGRVSMDMITVDVTDHTAVQIGSRAVLWGFQPGVDEVARHSDTIGYELLAGMPKRVPRVVEKR
ncbi:alanine racemase [Congregibacter variabilis]|uniref:Alanine racemase n=1 Tax=Congregibacter variabilis TaxID=3081200 RepID=A0ABZ0I5U2_9GAMM|nr:alanine racemase [Congregibacter sp. IMCC43200]